jgi:hypothetical protein
MAGSGPNFIFLGHGVADTLQLTVESQRILARVGKAYCIHLPPNLRRYLRQLRVQCVDLTDRFRPGRSFADVYLEIADFLLRRAAEERPVVVLTHGNPLVLNSLNRFLIMQAGQRGLSVEAYPGISPIDTFLCQLGLDIGTFGLQIFEARQLVTRKLRVNPSVPLLLLQPAGLAARQISSSGEQSADAYRPLVGYLANFYSADHPVTLLNPVDGLHATTQTTVPLRRLLQVVPHLLNTSNLFVDAVREGESAGPQERPAK